MKSYIIFSLILLSLFFYSCVGNVINLENEDQTGLGQSEKIDSLFEQDDNTYEFKTNNTEYLKESGYTIWTVNEKNRSKSYIDYKISISKISGRSDMGFGIIYACDEEETMKVVLINVLGKYCIGNIEKGKFKTTKEWTYTNLLRQNYGQVNELEISFNEVENRFVLLINGRKECDINNDITDFSDTGRGFVVTLAPNENFKTSYVHINFSKQNQGE
ncbi:MAG: hypothetical protein MJ179_04920 [Treponema sp.]|nr:hypothetical protein [Treponema sp.]